MRKLLFLALVERLKLIVDTRKQPVFRHFDLWNNQLQHLQEEKIFETPAIFIEFQPLQWKSTGNNLRQAELNFNLHIVYKTKALTAANSSTQTEALMRFELADAIHKQLRGWSPDRTYCGTIAGTASVTDNDHDQLIADVEEFKCQVIDHSAVVELQKVEDVDPVVVINI